jgi:hypothetical protein
MKGIFFTELVGFLEQQIGIIKADQVLLLAELPNEGAFTSVGNYPAGYALKIVEAASTMTGIPFDRLCQDYGSHLYTRLAILFPTIVAHYRSAEDMLAHVASHIHEEVIILYPDARTPSITTTVEAGQLHVRYESHRPLAHLAYGLIRQCLSAFGDPREVRWVGGGTLHDARFVLALPATLAVVEMPA